MSYLFIPFLNVKFIYPCPSLACSQRRWRKNLSLLLSKYFYNGQFYIILFNSFSIGSFFNFKDKLPKHMQSSIIYKFCCWRCSSDYVGMTSRSLYQRVAEHSGRSFRTGRWLARPPHSSIRIHAEECDSRVSVDNFSILTTASNNLDLRILESLYIYKRNPSLNDTQSSFPLIVVS